MFFQKRVDEKHIAIFMLSILQMTWQCFKTNREKLRNIVWKS